MNDALTLSPAGLKLVQSFEGCEKAVKGSRRFKAYVDPVGVLTIGWGHTNATGRRFTADTVWTQAECDAALREDMAKFESAVRGLVKVELEQCQFDALVSFAYNCGVGNLKSSTLLRKVNRRDFSGAAREFAKWNKAGGRVLKGLTRRRAAEATLFQGAGCIEVNAREDGPMAQAGRRADRSRPRRDHAEFQDRQDRPRARTGRWRADHRRDRRRRQKAQSAKDAAESLGLWDIATSALQSPRVLFGIAALVAIGLLIYWRHRDHS